MSNKTSKETQPQVDASAVGEQEPEGNSSAVIEQKPMSQDEKKSSRETTSILLALQFGALLLTTSIKGFIEAPYVYYGWLLAYYVIGLTSIFFLGMIFYITLMPVAKQPVKREGISTHLWWTSLLCLLIFFSANIVSNHQKPPSIEDITISNMTPHPGDLVKFAVKIKSPDSTKTSIKWQIKDDVLSTNNYLFYNVQHETSVLTVLLFVTNRNGEAHCTLHIPVANNHKGEEHGTTVETPTVDGRHRALINNRSSSCNQTKLP